MRPLARKQGLIIEGLDDETLVYVLDSHKAHCLNSTSAAVWRLCDGRRDVAALARALESETGVPAHEDLVWLALEQLGGAHLLTDPMPRTARISRRRLIRKLGEAAALPLIVSIVSPTAAQAATCIPNRPGCAPVDAPCTTSSNCCACCCKAIGGGNFACKPGGGNCLPP